MRWHDRLLSSKFNNGGRHTRPATRLSDGQARKRNKVVRNSNTIKFIKQGSDTPADGIGMNLVMICCDSALSIATTKGS
jgi:hypothetical protein